VLTGRGTSCADVAAELNVKFAWITLELRTNALSVPRNTITFISKSLVVVAIFRIPMLGSVGTICD